MDNYNEHSCDIEILVRCKSEQNPMEREQWFRQKKHSLPSDGQTSPWQLYLRQQVSFHIVLAMDCFHC